MKVAHVIIGLTMGGAEKVVVDLCTKSKEHPDHHFYVVSLTSDMDRKPDLDQIGIPVISLGIKKNGSHLIKAVMQLRRFIKKENIDIIHAHMFHAYFIALLASGGRSVPIVFTGHSTNIGSKLREYIVWATKKWRMCDIIFSKDQRRFFHKKGENAVIIPNGIDVEGFRRLQVSVEKNKPFTFLNVGNLEVEKNQLSLIYIAEYLKERVSSFQIKIVGEGSKMPELQSLIAKNGLEDYIKLLGKRKDVPKLMASSHCYVLPSIWEGMPITILEAGATGIPVISSPVGNVPLLLDEERGYIVSIDQFADTMEYVMDHYNESLEMAKRLQSHISDHFSLETIYDEHIKLYKKAMRQ